MSMRVLVTGATGFIGEYFCHTLRREGHSVTGLDLIPPREGLPLERFVRGDLRDPTAVRSALEGCDSVLNLAAAHHDFGIAHETYFGVNETGARILCDETAKPIVESSEPHPLHDYGASKLAGEKVFRQWTAKGGGRSCLVIRPTVTFGPNNFANMYSLIRQIHRGRFVVAGDGSNVKSLSYV
jgi:nucleoside-diphosphate-sugar epimerase